MASVRLNVFLARAGVASRRKADSIIQEGRVTVDGQVVTSPGTRIDPGRQAVEVDGSGVKPRADFESLLVYKPRGYLSTARDPFGRPKVVDLVKSRSRLYPAGRLDLWSEGLLILTNDGELAYRVTHPRYGVDKTYVAVVRGNPVPEAIDKLRKGVVLEDECTRPARVKALRRGRDRSVLEITLKEGKKRQVRRMLDAVGHPVMRLVRTRIGQIGIGGLKPGQYRPLTKEEVDSLKWPGKR